MYLLRVCDASGGALQLAWRAKLGILARGMGQLFLAKKQNKNKTKQVPKFLVLHCLHDQPWRQ